MKGNEILVTPVKFENHRSNDALDEVIYELQDLLYFYATKEIVVYAKCDILDTIEKLANKAKEIECDDKVQLRKDELLTNMRKIYKSVRSYEVHPYKKEDVEIVQKLIQYLVAKSIKAKSGNIEQMLKQMEENKKAYKIYVKPFLELKLGVMLHTGNFIKIQNELLQLLGKKYMLEDYD